MKKIAFLFLSFIMVMSVIAGPRKPKLMCVPAQNWCVQNGYVQTYIDQSGRTINIPDYQRVFDENRNMIDVISAIENFFINEGYQSAKLATVLNNIRNRSARENLTTAGGGISSSPIDELNKIAKQDITVEVYFTIKRQGPYNYVEFNVGAVDAYTGSPISQGNIGRGTAAASYDLVNQLEEAVLSFKDKFINDMDTYYDELFANGRQVVIRCTKAENSSVDFESEYDGEELGTLIENWVSENAFKGNYSLQDKTENEVYFDYVNIPMLTSGDKPKAVSADTFSKPLAKYIEQLTGVKCRSDVIGLGEVNIILGGKQ